MATTHPGKFDKEMEKTGLFDEAVSKQGKNDGEFVEKTTVAGGSAFPHLYYARQRTA